MPRSLLFFVASGVVFLLQAFPYTGIFLMFMLAMVWSVVLVNLGFIGIAVEVLLRRVSFAWILLPLGWYGGYAGWVISDEHQLALVQREIAAANARVRLSFDPAREVLVTRSGDHSHDGPPAAWLAQNFPVPVAYGEVRSSDPRDRFRAHRLADRAACELARDDPQLGAAGIRPQWFHEDEGSGWKRRLVTAFCIISTPEKPALPMVRLHSTLGRQQRTGLPVELRAYRIDRPDGRSAQVTAGTATPLRWFPMPAMGCGLNSGAPAWECGASFMRRRVPLGDGPSAVTDALGLRKLAPGERRAADAGPLKARLEAIGREARAHDLAMLERIIADPAAKIDTVPFATLRDASAVVAARADAIMAGLERAAAVDQRARDNGRNLGHLIAGLDDAAFQRQRTRLLALYSSVAGKSHWLWETEDLVGRLGDLGPAALAALDGGWDVKWAGRGAIVRAWCGIGAPAAGHVRARLIDYRDNQLKGSDRPSEELYATMLRLGLRAEAGPPKQNWGPRYADIWARVTPGSPRTACDADFRR